MLAGHAAFHRQAADGAAAELDGVAGAAGGADGADDRQDVLGGDALAQLAIDGDQHGLRLLLQQALGRQHVLDFGGADAVRQAGEGAVASRYASRRRRRSSWQRGAVFRADDVDDALRDPERKIGQRADFADVGVRASRPAAGRRI